MKPLSLAALLLLATAPIFAGMRRDPVPHAITSPGKHYVFTMVPGPKGAEYSKGSGACYKVEADGSFKALWKTEGWYSEDIHLHYDGMALARTGSWQSGDQEEGMKASTLALALYKEGKLIKSYKVSDLVKDVSKLQYSEGGLMWQQYQPYVCPAFPPGEDFFQVMTLDGILYRFDMNTGEIVKRTIQEAKAEKAE